MILLCSAISLPLLSAMPFFSVASEDAKVMPASSDSQAADFSLTATFCIASFSFRTVSISLASAIFSKPPARRSHCKK